MAIAQVVQIAIPATANGTNSSPAVDTTGATLLVAFVDDETAGAAAPSDNKSNTWSPLTSKTGQFTTGRLFYVANPVVGSGHVFSNTGGTNFGSAVFMAFSGTATTSPFDQESGAGTSGATTLQPGSITPSQANCVLVTGVGFGSTQTYSINSGFSTPLQTNFAGGVGSGSGMSYLVQTSASAVNPTWTPTSSTEMAAVMASFKAPGGATVITSPFWYARAYDLSGGF